MKTWKEMIRRAAALTAALTLALTACGCSENDDNDDSPPPVAFPALERLTVDAGDECTLAFSAGTAWTLTSSAAWCSFVDGDFTQTTISGQAGSASIVIRITDANQSHDRDDVAQITMSMGGQTQTVYEITRLRKGVSALVVKDESGQEINDSNPLLIKGGTIVAQVTTKVTLEFGDTNASLGVLTAESASWVTVVSADGGYELSFNEQNSDGLDPKYPVAVEEHSVVTFAAQSNGQTVARTAIPVYYEGYAPEALTVEPSYMSITADEEGAMTGEGGISGSEITQYGSELLSTVTTRNDEFEIVEFAYTATYDQWGTPETVDYDFSAGGDLDWLTTEKTAGETDPRISNRVRLTVSTLPEATQSRQAMVMILPKAVYDRIEGNFSAGIIDPEINDIKSEFSSYIMANITQQAKSEEPAGVAFVGYYYTDFGSPLAMTFDEVIGQGLGLEPKMEDISDTPEGEAIYTEYGMSEMSKKNVWKATVPARLMSDADNRLGIAVTGMSGNYTLGQAFSVSGIASEEVDGVETMNGQRISLRTVYLTGGGKPYGYQVVVLNETTGMIDGVCLVEVTD